MTVPFIVKYPLTDADLHTSLFYAECNMRALDQRARLLAGDLAEFEIEAQPDLAHNFAWSWEEIMFHSHLQNIQNIREGRVV